MNDTLCKPDFIPLPARTMTIGELARTYESNKPERGYLRICFNFLRFQPSGILRSVKETAPGQVEIKVSLGALRSRRYVFDEAGDNTAGTPCWVWTASDENAAAAVGAPAA